MQRPLSTGAGHPDDDDAAVTELAPITYFAPSSPAWARVIARRPPFVILNPSSGAGLTSVGAYYDLATALHAEGIAVLGYEPIRYGLRPLAELQTAADTYRRWYGVDGMFWDEADPFLMTYTYAKVLNGKAKSFATPYSPDGKGWAVFNAGRRDVGALMLAYTGRALWGTYEGTRADYVPASATGSPARELHLIYGSPDPTGDLALIGTTGVGYGYATGDNLPNPWDTFPRLYVDEFAPLVGPPLVTVDQATAKLRANAPGRDPLEVAAIVTTYAAYCDITGISLGCALGQMMHETGSLTSWWSRPPRRNLAGLGVNGSTRMTTPADLTRWAWDDRTGVWRAGFSFPTWDDAVLAHVGRMVGYRYRDDDPALSADARYVMAQALAPRPLPLAIRGTTIVLRQFGAAWNPSGKGWADPGTFYGEGVARSVNSLIAA